ncbi:RNA guanine-N7 methyltransferase activating subunit [Rhinophrynus dorsalis]
MTEPTDSQKVYEDMFSHRFSVSDEEYQKYLKKEDNQPPIVEDWRTGFQRNRDRYRDNSHQQGWEGRRSWSNDSYNQGRNGRGRGNYYTQYRQERSYYPQDGRQGYNTNNQRFSSDHN